MKGAGQWAYFFDMVEWEWKYRPIELESWTPTFSIKISPSTTLLAEVKSYREIDKFKKLPCCAYVEKLGGVAPPAPYRTVACLGTNLTNTLWYSRDEDHYVACHVKIWIYDREDLADGSAEDRREHDAVMDMRWNKAGSVIDPDSVPGFDKKVREFSEETRAMQSALEELDAIESQMLQFRANAPSGEAVGKAAVVSLRAIFSTVRRELFNKRR